MTGSERAGVTPAGIRDGSPEVLRALVAARGSAVLAYCRAVCPPDEAGRAAAEAFARFRAAVVDATDVTSIDPDALLLGATRHAAASLARTSRPAGRSARKDDTCAAVPGLLAARAAGMISADETERLQSHLERCPACRGLAEDFDQAEEAYRTATSVPVPAATVRVVLAALQAAAPVRDEPGGEDDDPPHPQVPPADDADVPDEHQLGEHDDEHDAHDELDEHEEPDEHEDLAVADDPEAAEPLPSPPEEAHEGPEHDERPHDPFYDGPLHPDDDEHDFHEDFDDPPAAAEPRLPQRPRMPRIALPPVPRPRRSRRDRGAADSEKRDLRPVLLPGVVVLAALIVFVAASTDFGGDDPEPPRAERQRPELRVERPVTTPLPVEPVVEEPLTTTTPPATTTPGATAPATTGTTTPATPPDPTSTDQTEDPAPSP